MKRLPIIIMAIMTAAALHAQNKIADVLNVIEQNNTTLKVLAEDMKTQKTGNRTDMTLPDPEIGFGYLWGKTKTVGIKKDVCV